MPQYELDLLIDDKDLINIRTAQMNIILAKPVGSGSPNVAWQSFDPFAQNAVTWSETYGMYASTTSIANGATITKMSTVSPANDAAYYSFTSAAVFNGPIKAGGPPPGTYQVNNDMPTTTYPTLTFGLMQGATINGTDSGFRPLNAAITLAGFSAQFTPLTTVYVWLQSNLASETVITKVTSNAAIVTFGGSITTLALKFDPTKGVFVPYSSGVNELSASAESPNVKYLMRGIL